MDGFTGELAALAAALCFSFASIGYTLAGRNIGAAASMTVSLTISLVMLFAVHWVAAGEFFPAAEAERWLYLSLSSIGGFVISSILLLRAFQYIGPRLSMLVTSSAPILAAVLAWFFIGEALPANAVLGIVLVVAGIAGVVGEGAGYRFSRAPGDYRRGLLVAGAAAIAQGASFVLMSKGVAGDYNPLSANLIRALVGAGALWVLLLLRGNLLRDLRLMRAPRPLLFITAASVAGPVVGTIFVLLSLQFTSVGISSTLTATTPILLIPISFVLFRERVTVRAMAGTAVAVAGVAALFI